MNVSGKLSHSFKMSGNKRYIGILSRFSGNSPDYKPISGRCTVILSGPEPQRSILKQKLTRKFISLGMPAVILEGKPGKVCESFSLNNIVYYSHPEVNKTIKLLKESETIIARSGYTTIMELISIGRSALLIPTPGQTEQEYLAKYLSDKGWFSSVAQKKLDEITIIPSTSAIILAGIVEESRKLLEIALAELLK